MATYPADRRAADARIMKATRLPNPELTFDAEDFFGTGGTSGLGSALLNTVITQVVERGGKRTSRVDAARTDGAVMDAEYESTRLEVIQKTGELYIDAVAAHEKVAFLTAAMERSSETLKLVEKLSEVGRVTRSAVQQADLEVRKMELEISSAKKTRQMASQALTAQWGDTKDSLFPKNGLAAPPRNLAGKSSIQGGLAKHPGLKLAQAKIAQAEANLQLAKSGRYADISVAGGGRKNNATNENSGLFEFSIPLQLFDRGQDGVDEMSALLEKANTESAGEKRRLDTEFTQAWSELAANHEAAQRVRESLMPSASALFKSAEESFRAGQITSLEYLAAQQQFHEIRSSWLTARRDYQISAARVQALTNRSL
jgi:cobalt-zinc-cadmium efflux system outer membrane protein